jgi:hypothetical protein
MTDLPPALRDQIKTLDSDIATQQREENEAREQAATQEKEETRLYDTMNFRERYLRGWFGGDSVKVERYRAARRLKDEFNARADGFATKRQELDGQAHTALDGYLREGDTTYQALLEPKERAERAKEAIDIYLEKVQDALNSIDSAQSMETMDMVSKNKGISLMSSMSNSSARSAVREVESATPAFQAAMQDYSEFLKDYKLPAFSADFGDMTDLVFDMMFDGGFDFMSIFALSALGRAEDQMEDVRDKVKEADRFVCDNHEKVEQAMAEYRGKVRQLCLRPA